jgi:integral membrane protein (TIGR01906 family)
LGLFRSLSIGFFVVAIPLALITTNIRVAATEPRVYDYAVKEYGAASVSGIPESELLRANRELRDYFTASNPGPLRIEVRNNTAQGFSLFNARETAHLSDVRGVFRTLFTVQTIAVAGVLTMAVVMIAMGPVRDVARSALYGSLASMTIIAAAAFVALTGFDGAWTQLHLLTFSNDFWRLNPASDHLIQMFPEAFWRDVTILIGAVTILEAAAIAGAAIAFMVLTTQREFTESVPAAESPSPRPSVTIARAPPPEPQPRLPHRPRPAQAPRPRARPPQPREFLH